MTRSDLLPVAFVVATSALAAGTAAAAPAKPLDAEYVPLAARANAQTALERLAAGTLSHVSDQTAVYDFVRAPAGSVLAADLVFDAPESRALAFLRDHGALLGLAGEPESSLRLMRTETDPYGLTHVRFEQLHGGVPVFGAQVLVHLSDAGVTAVNGAFVPDLETDVPSLAPALDRRAAEAVATFGLTGTRILGADLTVYRKGLLEGFRGVSRLAWDVRFADARGPAEQVILDANTGAVMLRVPMREEAMYRRVYSPMYAPDNGVPDNPANEDLFLQRDEEGIAPAPVPPENPVPNFEGLFNFTGHVYRFYHSAWGRDSFDGKGARMRTVYLVSDGCTGLAYWNGSTTNYCPTIDGDDVVAHEWSHAYTQYTHGLIYAHQAGGLNEAYSDMMGESIDLLNGVDGQNLSDPQAGINNDKPLPDGQRWVVGEDVAAPLGPIRDMWDPESLSNPAKTSSANYDCGGAVHTNSGVPNFAFAMIVDGRTVKGARNVTFSNRGIGLTKATNIYWRAESVYQTPTTNFAQHEQALLASCEDLIGKPIKTNSTENMDGTPFDGTISAEDCAQIRPAMQATEMSVPPKACKFNRMFDSQVPAAAAGEKVVFSEDWESGMDGWTLTQKPVFPVGGSTLTWAVSDKLPANADGTAHAGHAAWAPDPGSGEENGGTCSPGGDVSGQFYMDSPAITLADAKSTLGFQHYVLTELGWDGGNVKISVNGGTFTIVPATAYKLNGPDRELNPLASDNPNTNPKAGEVVWTGGQGDAYGPLGPGGVWGYTTVDLSGIAKAGDSIVIRFDFGTDGCNGTGAGWYVDDITVSSAGAKSGAIAPRSSGTLLGGALPLPALLVLVLGAALARARRSRI